MKESLTLTPRADTTQNRVGAHWDGSTDACTYNLVQRMGYKLELAPAVELQLQLTLQE